MTGVKKKNTFHRKAKQITNRPVLSFNSPFLIVVVVVLIVCVYYSKYVCHHRLADRIYLQKRIAFVRFNILIEFIGA